MVHHLNTNKQFMAGNAILAFAVIFVVFIFVYMSLRMSQQKKEGHRFAEQYTITLVQGFAGDSVSLFLNDSLLLNRTLGAETQTIQLHRFAEENALLIVNNLTEQISLFPLEQKGGTYRFEKRDGEVVLMQ